MGLSQHRRHPIVNTRLDGATFRPQKRIVLLRRRLRLLGQRCFRHTHLRLSCLGLYVRFHGLLSCLVDLLAPAAGRLRGVDRRNHSDDESQEPRDGDHPVGVHASVSVMHAANVRALRPTIARERQEPRGDTAAGVVTPVEQLFSATTPLESDR